MKDEAQGRNWNHLCQKVQTWEKALKSQKGDHSSLTADHSALNNLMLKEFDTFGHTIDELCRRMKSMEREHFHARDEAPVCNLDDIRLSLETLIHKQMAKLEEALKAKISKCNAKVEGYHGEFVSSQIDKWRSRAFLDTQLSNQCYNAKGGTDKKISKRTRAPVP